VDLRLSVQSVPKVVSLNTAHCEVYLYNIGCAFVLFLLAIALSVLFRNTVSDCPFGIFKIFLIKSVSALRQVGGFLHVFRFPQPTDRHDTAEIALKVALSTRIITRTLIPQNS
jgi:hypothetical protein